MDEKKRNIQAGCTIVGTVGIFTYIILTVAGSNNVLFLLRILFAGIATIAYAIKMRIEVSNDEDTICIIAICLFNIVLTAMKLQWT